MLIVFGALFVLAAIVLMLLQPEISERTFYTGEVYAWAGVVALVGVVLAAVGLRRTTRGEPGRVLAGLTLSIGGIIVIVVTVVFTFVLVWAWLVYG